MDLPSAGLTTDLIQFSALSNSDDASMLSGLQPEFLRRPSTLERVFLVQSYVTLDADLERQRPVDCLDQLFIQVAWRLHKMLALAAMAPAGSSCLLNTSIFIMCF